MNRILSLAAMIALCANATTQAQTATYPYTYSHDTATYAYLPDTATTLLGSTGWDDEVIDLPLPSDFIFTYQGDTVTEWQLDTYGGLYPNEVGVDYGMSPILGMASDYEDNGSSAIKYQVTGTTGSRIAKIEFRNVGFFGGLSTDSANFQIWLYEGSNKIEYHAGPSNVDSNTIDYISSGGFVVVGLVYNMGINDSAIFHIVNYNNDLNTDSILTMSMDGGTEEDFLNLFYGNHYPDNGTVFSFAAPNSGSTSIAKIPSAIATVYPNPAARQLSVQLKEVPKSGAYLGIVSIEGKEITRLPATATTTKIDLDLLAKGTYFLYYEQDGHRDYVHFAKQ
ncbi:MAG: T9SS type A sorting domain-containing protein [Edaphocola sp.]